MGGRDEAGRLGTLLGLGLIAATSLGALIVLTAATESVDGQMLWPEVTKALVSILTVALIGGAAKYLFDEHVREREKRDRAAALALEERHQEVGFVQAAIDEAERIHSDLQNARTIMMAHKSAKSYRDQMQIMIGLQVRVESLCRSVQARWEAEGRHKKEVAKIADRQTQVSAYLSKLIAEYQGNYKPVSDAQRIDEAEANAAIERFVRDRPNGMRSPTVRPKLTWQAWSDLSDEERFPVFNDLAFKGDQSEYSEMVAPNCTQTVDALTAIRRRILSLGSS